MSTVIQAYYEQANVKPLLIKQKMEKLARHPDIREELEYWITHRSYKQDGLREAGYTAKSLSELSQFLNGEGAFMMLIELREHPEQAKKQMQRGFALK